MARDQDRGPQPAPRCLVLLGVSERGGRNVRWTPFEGQPEPRLKV